MLLLWLTMQAAGVAGVTTYEAEQQETLGKLIGPDRRFGTLAAEASGRRAVRLDSPQHAVRIRLQHAARGVTVRYSLPDSSDGRGRSARALLEADGRTVAIVPLTSRYSHYYGRYPFTNRPQDGRGHHFWDEVRILLPRRLPAGTSLALKPTSQPFTVDLIETEEVAAPAARPPEALSVLDFGADPQNRRDSTAAFARAIETARGRRRILFVPQGRYRIDGHLIVDRVRIAGAGSWYSVIRGHHVGLYGRKGGSWNVSISGLGIESDVADRNDHVPRAAIGGTFNRSEFRNLYLHHANVGIWLDGPAHDLLISGNVIADLAADGINLHRGIVRARVENNRIRNSGDDGIASWSDRIANRDVMIRGNSVTAPVLANGIAVYGGQDIIVSGNSVADTLTQGGGIHLGTRFRSAPFGGTIRIDGNKLTRAGSMDPNWNFGIGALWLYALERPIHANILLSNNNVEDAGCEAVQLLGPKRIDGVLIDGLRIEGPVSSVFALQAAGSMQAQRISLSGPPTASVQVPHDFRLKRGSRERSWTTRPVQRAQPPRCTFE